MSEKFIQDLMQFYALIGERQVVLGSYFEILEDNSLEHIHIQKLVDELLVELELESNKQNRLSAISRLVNLRDEQLMITLENAGFSEKEIAVKKRIAFLWAKNFHLKSHEEILKIVEEKEFFNPFYRRLLRGVHEVGIAMSYWQDAWHEHIINKINPKLKALFGEDVIAYLQENNLFEADIDGTQADRSYSVLVQKDDSFEAQSYANFFGEDVRAVVYALDSLVLDLETLNDDATGQKEVYIAYFKALSQAFGQTDRSKLLQDWISVDRAWMQVKSPLQVGHPMEYYEDHYRKAVALEWDLRISNPKHITANNVYENILYMYTQLFEKIGQESLHIYELTLANLQRVQLYIGRPALYYGAQFNGLFSAQVVPNDERVSKEEGKKIFAFADNILDSLRAKPFLKISREVFGETFINKERELIFKKPQIWHKVYEVTTIGHEFGHILWLDSDSENRMNSSGAFKNIEEFKATMGGLMAFFANEDETIKQYVLQDVIKRAVGLIGWMKTDEVQPYYCEGLIHLSGMFASGVLHFDGSLHVDTQNYDALKQWYSKTYEELAVFYLAKKDAKDFLNRFASKEDGVYIPVEKTVADFVRYYWNLHKSIGRDIDELSLRSDWV
ncbi:MAG: invasion protein CiaB [Sulfurospirillum sp.]|nr:invasion protein CiaB [Sulfurospirillum sp.]